MSHKILEDVTGACVKAVFASRTPLVAGPKGFGQLHVLNSAWPVVNLAPKTVVPFQRFRDAIPVHARIACVSKTHFAVRPCGMNPACLFVMIVEMAVVLIAGTESWSQEKNAMMVS